MRVAAVLGKLIGRYTYKPYGPAKAGAGLTPPQLALIGSTQHAPAFAWHSIPRSTPPNQPATDSIVSPVCPGPEAISVVVPC